jgi:hypothetical protein
MLLHGSLLSSGGQIILAAVSMSTPLVVALLFGRRFLGS